MMQYGMVGLKRMVSLVILPIDDFTEKVITDAKLRVYTEQGKRLAICKEDGYRIFCDLKESKVKICAEGPLYQKQTVEFLVSGASVVFKLRMIPNSGYPIQRGVTSIRGFLKPKSKIQLFFPELKKKYKLLYDYAIEEQKRSLSLFFSEAVSLEGKLLYIQNKEEGEFFRVTGQTDENVQIDRVLQKSYKKIGTTIYPVYEVFAEEDGSFYLPIRGLLEGENLCNCRILEGDEEKEVCKKIFLQGGKENCITGEEMI